MKTKTENFSRIQVKPTIKDNLKAIAASRHIPLKALTEQVLNRFLESRRELLEAAAETNMQEGVEQ